MKFSEVFAASFIRSFSIRVGILIGLIASFFTGWKYGILIGATAVLAISLILPILFYFTFLPYKRMKKGISGPFLFDEPVRFTVKKGTVGGFLVITEKTLIFLSGEADTKRLELSRAEVRRVIEGDGMTVDIYLNEKQYIRVFSGACEEILDILREQGWNTVG